MKKVILFSSVFFFLTFSWSFNPCVKEAKAITTLELVSPSDSVRLTTDKPTFTWKSTKDPGLKEIRKKYWIAVARDFELSDRIWEDSSIAHPKETVVYGGPSFDQWNTYFWSVRVQVDSIRSIDTTETGIDTTFVTLWYKFIRPRALLYTRATLIEIPDSLYEFPENLQTIQVGIIWATSGDTVLVEPGIYYENLRFYKKGVMLASHFVRDGDTASIKNTVIDGDSLTRGEERASVIYFTSAADSNSGVIGFTIRNGRGTKVKVEAEEKTNGGGIFCDRGSSPTIFRNVITNNHVKDDGGGIFCYSAAPNVFNNIITDNSAGGSGGAIQCYFSIKTKPSATSGPPGGGEGGTVNILGKTDPAAISAESDSKAQGDDGHNYLYPRDATEVLPASALEPLLKPAQGNPPVPVVTYYPVKSKYPVGDTIWLDASQSYDVDSLAGDSIKSYFWDGQRHNDCQDPDKTTRARPDDQWSAITTYTVTGSNGGLCSLWVIIEDTERNRSRSDTISPIILNVELPPDADAGEDVVVAPGDTVWLDGSGSCDINPDDDTTLGFLWSQVSGPVSVTIIDPQKVQAYFVAYDETYSGEHVIELRVSDSDTFSLATKNVTVDRYPVAVTFDSVAGFIETDCLTLDASQSFDPDAAGGDYVKYFIWKGISHITCGGTSALNISIDSTREVQCIPATKGGGIYKVSLYVRDKYGVRSKNTDTLLISVQLPPVANAGLDTIVRPGSWANLHGSACELNWDQVSSLKYRWFKDPRNPVNVGLLPDSVSKEVRFTTSQSGTYRFFLRVTDPYGTSGWDDTLKVTLNRHPRAVITKPERRTTFAEGDAVELDASDSYDPDAEVFNDSLSFKWTVTSWPGYPAATYKPAIIDSARDTTRFIPVKHGEYKIKVLVHDSYSRKQDPPTADTLNWQEVTVKIDTTFAYPFIMGNLISSNTAGSRGGGINCIQSSPEITNNIFYKNRSGSSGGAICARSVPSPTSIEVSALYVKRNIFFGNTSSDSTGGGIADLKPDLSPSASVGLRQKMVVTTNAFWNNAGGDLFEPSGDVMGNIFVYPRLIDPEYGDFRLECSSPCLEQSIGLLLWLYPDTCEVAPPLGMISLSLFQNPVATAVADFMINTDVPLKAPPVGYVTVGENSPAPMDFTSISSTTYRGNFVFTTSDIAEICVFASTVQDQDTSLVRDFTVQLIAPGQTGKLVSHDNRLGVSFPQGAAGDEMYVTCISVSDAAQYGFEDEGKIALGEAYQLSPLADFKKELTVSFPLEEYDLTEKDKTLFSIYKYEKDGWEKQASFLNGNSVCAKVSGLGVYRLVYDQNQEHISALPESYQLFQNYPNPFNPRTVIKYDLPDPGQVNIAVYNVLGQKVKTLVDEHQQAGRRSVGWDGKDEQGRNVASGIYFYKIITPGFEKTMKMVLLK